MPAKASALECPGPARRPQPPALVRDCFPVDRHSLSLSVSPEGPKVWTLGGASWGLVEPVLAGCGIEGVAYDYPTLPQVPVLTLVTPVIIASPSWISCAP